MDYREVIDFWFHEAGPRRWFARDSKFDERIRERFQGLWQEAAACELYPWRDRIQGRLAEILLLDQFSRNLHRGSAQAFSRDPLALALAQEAVATGRDRVLPARQRAFLYMPFMHSESLLIHEQAMALFAQPGLEDSLKYETRHREIIRRFGRYPHRNAILGRSSTPEEEAFLEKPGSRF